MAQLCYCYIILIFVCSVENSRYNLSYIYRIRFGSNEKKYFAGAI